MLIGLIVNIVEPNYKRRILRCPYCGYTEIKEINKVQQALAGVAATITTFGLLLINPNKGPAIEAGKKVNKKLCPQREYICKNPLCNKYFKVNL